MSPVVGTCNSSWPVCVVLLLCLLISCVVGDACPKGLPLSCTCGPQLLDNQTLWTVHCTHFVARDTSFLRYVPLYAEALILDDVSFTTDPEPDSFELRSVEEENTFSKVRYIKMENVDHLINVPLHSLLCSFPNLESAYLPNNTLRWATFNATCVPNLKVLDLQWNHVHYVLNHTLSELDYLPDLVVNLRHNRFVCDCNLESMLRWLPNATVHVVEPEEYVCTDGYPEYLSGHRLVRVDTELLRCQPDLETSDEPWIHGDPNFGYFLYAVLGFLLVVAFAVLAFGFYFNFPFVRQWFKGVEKKPMMQRRRYATLDTAA